MNKITSLFIVLFFANIIEAQTLLPTVVNSSGGVIQNSSNSLEWSLGELAVSTLTSPNNLLTQGFLQPQIGVVSTENIFDESQFSVFPNPVLDKLNFQTDISDIAIVMIHDISGILIFQVEFQQSIDLTNLASGTFVVSLFDKKNAFIQSFKITKI